MPRGEAPQTIDGKSLLPLLKNPDEAWPDRNLFFHVGRWSDAAGPDQSKYAATAGFAVRNTRYRLVNHEELYDILNDSGETKNLYSEKPEVVDNMQVAYDAWWDEVRPYMVNEGPQQLEPNPYHLKYQEQLKNGALPIWEKPKL